MNQRTPGSRSFASRSSPPAPGGEIYHLTSRSKTAGYATRGLIDRYGRHPQRKKGLVPLITLSIGTYPNRKTGRDAYKPVYQIVGWVQKDGSAPPTKPDLVSSGYPFNDEIPRRGKSHAHRRQQMVRDHRRDATRH